MIRGSQESILNATSQFGKQPGGDDFASSIDQSECLVEFFLLQPEIISELFRSRDVHLQEEGRCSGTRLVRRERFDDDDRTHKVRGRPRDLFQPTRRYVVSSRFADCASHLNIRSAVSDPIEVLDVAPRREFSEPRCFCHQLRASAESLELIFKPALLARHEAYDGGLALDPDLPLYGLPGHDCRPQRHCCAEHTTAEAKPIFKVQVSLRRSDWRPDEDQQCQNDGQTDQADRPEPLIPLLHARSMAHPAHAVETPAGNLP